MIQIEQLAEAALSGDALLLRSLAQDFLRQQPTLSEVPQPETDNPRVVAAAAALVELFAARSGQDVPEWTEGVESLEEPVFLVSAAATMPRLRALCEAESPAPLRKRGFYAPPNYLEFA